MGTGVALELWHAGLHRLVLLECARPRAIRRLVVFSEAVFEGKARVEGLEARLCPDAAACRAIWQTGEALPLLVDEDGASLREFCPQAFVDATMSKKARGLSPNMADLVIALGPGIEAGRDVHASSKVSVRTWAAASGRDRPWPIPASPASMAAPNSAWAVPRVPVSSQAPCLWAAMSFRGRKWAGWTVFPSRLPCPAVCAACCAPAFRCVQGPRSTGPTSRARKPGLPVRAGAKVCDIEPLDHVPLDKVSSRARCLGRGVLRAIAARYNLPT